MSLVAGDKETGTMDAGEILDEKQGDLQGALQGVLCLHRGDFDTNSGGLNESSKSRVDKEKALKTQGFQGIIAGTPEGIRTPNLLIRSQSDHSDNISNDNGLCDSAKSQGDLQGQTDSDTNPVSPALTDTVNIPQAHPPDKPPNDFAILIRDILSLPLTPEEKAEAVRRLLAH